MTASAQVQLVVGGDGAESQTGILHAASPMLIGGVASVLGMVLIAPGVLRNGHMLVFLFLVPMLFVSIAIYAWSVLVPGDVVGLAVDTTKRTIGLIQSNPFAARRTEVAFADVSSLELTSVYDCDGYSAQSTVMTLANGQKLTLSIGLDAGNIEEVRRLIGLRG